jgi:hypothetical protein
MDFDSLVSWAHFFNKEIGQEIPSDLLKTAAASIL